MIEFNKGLCRKGLVHQESRRTIFHSRPVVLTKK